MVVPSRTIRFSQLQNRREVVVRNPLLGVPALAQLLALVALPMGGPGTHPTEPVRGASLWLEQVVADSTSYNVNAVVIVGPTEALLWDAQYHVRDAERLADRIAATGKHLKAIVLSHPDHDHFSGTAVIVKRFPGTPVYMTPTALAEFNKTAARDFGNEKSRNSAAMADSIITPVALPSNHLTVDGQAVEVIPDLQGDVLLPTNSVLWIPSLRAVLAADVVFNGVHPWFGASNAETRAAWQRSLQRITDLKPLVVVAGHKRTVDMPDSPTSIQAMAAYLKDFDAERQSSADAPGLIAAMKRKYPDWAVPVLLQYSAMIAYRSAKSPSPSAGNTQASSSGGQSAGAGWNPVGVYDFVMKMGEREIDGRIVITGTVEKYTGTIAPESAPELVPFDSVTAREGKIALAFTLPRGPAFISLTSVAADSLVGKLTGTLGVADTYVKKVR
jgi:glyoxylase-like metal-dependent hydrolase (beta-lactamase superfamily II)